MPRTTFAVSLSLLALLAPGQGVAGPPEGVSGAMVLDEVADGLRRYRREPDERKRVQWLWKLGSPRDPFRDYCDASSRDPRVVVALGEALYKPTPIEQFVGEWLLWHYYDPLDSCQPDIGRARLWWKKHEADLRRRAKKLP